MMDHTIRPIAPESRAWKNETSLSGAGFFLYDYLIIIYRQGLGLIAKSNIFFRFHHHILYFGSRDMVLCRWHCPWAMCDKEKKKNFDFISGQKKL
jgi:hypothetical protein